MQFDRGYLSPYFVTDMPSGWRSVLDDAIHSHPRKEDLGNIKDLIPVLEKIAQQGKPLPDRFRGCRGRGSSQRSSSTSLRGTINGAAVKAPGFGDRRKAMLEDMAALTGGTWLSPRRRA
jgi:chaperonin GroEL